jgi:uncharacterized membrane protein
LIADKGKIMDDTNGGLRLNLGDIEHLTVLAAGAALVGIGLSRRSLPGFVLAGIGGALLARGGYGYKRIYDLLGVEADDPTRLSLRALKIQKSIVIDRSPEELYQFWRNVENLPRVMSNLISVSALDENRSHWVAKAPAGTVVEWDAEIINDVTNRLIAWRSLEGGDVDNAGSVHFDPVGEGTELWLTIRYTPPGDVAGAAVARLFGADPEREIEADLLRFKQEMEQGRAA